MSMLKRSFLLSPLLVACYSYQPIEPAAAPVGTEVRAHISGAASDRIAPMIGEFNKRVLTGTVEENKDGAVTLEVQSGAAQNTAEITPLFQRVPLQRDDVTQLETRTLNRAKTTTLISAFAVGVVAVSYVALHSGGGRSGTVGGGEGPPPINRIPIFKLHF
jgi:hypothetical protein